MRFLIAACLALITVAASAAKPNVLIVYVDDLGIGDTAVYGHPVIQTPNINKLASEGMRFTQFYAPSALCSPSRAGLLTGRTPYRTGVESWIPDNSEVSLARGEFTIAEMLKKVGFHTAVIGKWHLNGGLHMTDAPQPRDFGFDHQYGLAAWVKNQKAEQAGVGKLFPDNIYRNNVPIGETSKFSAELISDEAINWLSKRGDNPFFLLLTYSEVHTPVASPEQYLAMYDQYLTHESRTNPWSYYMTWVDKPYRGKGEYYANVTYLDAQLGRVLEYLRAENRLDNTLVFFTSDNGPLTSQAEMPWEIGMAGETNGLRGKKRYLFEGGIRVPGIVRWPGHVEAGVVSKEPLSSLDIMPTVADLLHLQLPEAVEIDGQSFSSVLKSEPGFRRNKILYWSIPTPDGLEYAVRRGDWKMIFAPDGKAEYLFELSSDPYEINNLLHLKTEVAEELTREFRLYQQSVEGREG